MDQRAHADRDLRRTHDFFIIGRADVHFFPSLAQLLRNAAANSVDLCK
jgi:hypothetical protein